MSKALKWSLIGVSIAVVVVAVVLICVFIIPRKEEVEEPNDPGIEEPVEKEPEIVQEGVTVDGATYTIYDDGAAVVTSIEELEIDDGEVVIPSTIIVNGVEYEVTSIADGTAENPILASDEITKITIPSTITSIGKYFAYGCENLTTVEYEGTLEEYVNISLGGYRTSTTTTYDLYIDGELVTKLKIPEDTETINGSLVERCSSITSVYIPASVKTIGSWAFAYCENLAEVTIAENSQLTTIGEHAFRDTAITSFEFPASLIIIEIAAFANCTSLQYVDLTTCVSLESLGNSAFTGCTALVGVNLSKCEKITDIEGFTFNGCTLIKEVYVNQYIYENLTDMYSCGRILRNAESGTKVYVSVDIIKAVGGFTNSYLDNASNFTRSDEAVDGYYVYTKV